LSVIRERIPPRDQTREGSQGRTTLNLTKGQVTRPVTRTSATKTVNESIVRSRSNVMPITNTVGESGGVASGSGSSGERPRRMSSQGVGHGGRSRMPRPGEKNAPEFDPDKPEELNRFFERMDDWFEEEETAGAPEEKANHEVFRPRLRGPMESLAEVFRRDLGGV
jgi:hypothetical protein